MTLNAFSVFTNCNYLKRTDSRGTHYSTHDLIRVLFQAKLQAQLKKTDGNIKKNFGDGCNRMICILYQHYRISRRSQESQQIEKRQARFHLFKLQYKDHIEEFIAFVCNFRGKGIKFKFWKNAAEGLVVFARMFDENRFHVAQFLLELVLKHGIKNDEGHSLELRARCNLVQSLITSATGRSAEDGLNRSQREEKIAYQLASSYGDENCLRRLVRGRIHMLCKKGDYEEAERQLQDFQKNVVRGRGKKHKVAAGHCRKRNPLP